MQKSTVLVKNDFECILDNIEVQMVAVWSSRHGKHQTLAFLLVALLK